MEKTNRIWKLRKRPVGDVSEGDLDLVEEPVRALEDGEVLVRTVFLSLDPTNRIWMSDRDQYMPPVEIGDPMRGGGIAIVEDSRFDGLEKGDIVNTGLGQWALYLVKKGAEVNKLPQLPGVPLTAFMGPLGMTGMTAYFGLMDIGKPKEGETVVVSAAAGAVGSMVGQIAKIQGCRAGGIAGSDENCKWLTETAGFDAAINYKSEDIAAALDRTCPGGIDINFENVGGEIMDTILPRLNDFARMPLCGLISSYNATEPVPGPYNFSMLLMRHVTLKGYIVTDYIDRFPEGMQAMGQWLMEGKIRFETDIVEGLENAPASLERLFTGKNLGKLAVKVSEPE